MGEPLTKTQRFIVPDAMKKYVEYIRNTGQRPLPIAQFDDDWEPIGPMVRADMRRLGLIYYGGAHSPFPCPEGVYLRPDLADWRRHG